MVVAPEHLPRELGHQGMALGVRQAVAGVVDCAVLVDLHEVVEQALARYGDYRGVNTRNTVYTSIFKLTK